MARIRLTLPDDLPFSTELSVRVSDVNYGGHLGNDAVLSLAHEARIRCLAAMGCTETNVFGAGIIMTDAAVVYCAEAFLGDRLRVAVGFGDLTDLGCAMYYRFTDLRSGREIARVQTGLAFFDYAARKVVRMPEQFRAAVTARS